MSKDPADNKKVQTPADIEFESLSERHFFTLIRDTLRKFMEIEKTQNISTEDPNARIERFRNFLETNAPEIKDLITLERCEAFLKKYNYINAELDKKPKSKLRQHQRYDVARTALDEFQSHGKFKGSKDAEIMAFYSYVKAQYPHTLPDFTEKEAEDAMKGNQPPKYKEFAPRREYDETPDHGYNMFPQITLSDPSYLDGKNSKSSKGLWIMIGVIATAILAGPFIASHVISETKTDEENRKAAKRRDDFIPSTSPPIRPYNPTDERNTGTGNNDQFRDPFRIKQFEHPQDTIPPYEFPKPLDVRNFNLLPPSSFVIPQPKNFADRDTIDPEIKKPDSEPKR